MKEYCQNNLLEIKELLDVITLEQFVAPLPVLSDSTLSQHIRHILEFYNCVLNDSELVVNYDNRKRDKGIETDINYAKQYIDSLLSVLAKIEGDRTVNLVGNYGVSVGIEPTVIPSSILRELAYCLEHSIHHQALLKIGLTNLGLGSLVESGFGVAPATIRYRSA